jgi:hypothetical protein
MLPLYRKLPVRFLPPASSRMKTIPGFQKQNAGGSMQLAVSKIKGAERIEQSAERKRRTQESGYRKYKV